MRRGGGEWRGGEGGRRRGEGTCTERMDSIIIIKY